MRQLIKDSENWYKGNLHMHTTRSDGVLDPQAAAKLYREAGYDFLALTDHWNQSENKVEDGLLFLSGCEFDTGDMVNNPVYHIIGAGMEKEVDLQKDKNRDPQEIIDAINEAGGVAILAHPAWSVTIPEKCMRLKGLCGAEIYNTVSGIGWKNCRPDSSTYFDIWAARGKLLGCMAADDSHYYTGEQTRSFLMVGAEKLAVPAIKKALREGTYYASQGPVFRSLSCSDSKVVVECSPVETIIFYSNTVWCPDRVVTGGADGAEYRIEPTDRYVRVELIDRSGNHAWSSPFEVNR